MDNGSTDDSWSILQSKYADHPKIHLTRSEENLGFTKGNNLLFDQLQAIGTPPRYLVLLNNDTVVAADWLSELVSFAEPTQADLVSSKMIQFYDREKMDNAGHYLLPIGEFFLLGMENLLNDMVNPLKIAVLVRELDYIGGICCSALGCLTNTFPRVMRMRS